MKKAKGMFAKEYFWRSLISAGGIFMIILTLSIAVFLIVQGTETFTKFGHSLGEFLFSTDYKPAHAVGGESGPVGAAVFIVGSLLTCALALLIATPFSIAASIFMTEIAPDVGKKLFQPAVEIFVGIPSIVYGWTGLVIIVPLVKQIFNISIGLNITSAAIVLSVMIFPTITSVATDAIRSVPKEYRQAGYGLGSTRWQVIYKIVIPAAKPGILTGIILGLARAFGEALAVAMVIGKSPQLAKDLLSPTATLTTFIASSMGEAVNGSEHKAALWSMALFLFLISLIFIFLIHVISARGEKIANGKN